MFLGRAPLAMTEFSGERIAGPNMRKNTNPPTAVKLASGKRAPTDLLIKESCSRNTLGYMRLRFLYMKGPLTLAHYQLTNRSRSIKWL